MSLYEQVKLLYRNGLHKSVVDFGSMVITAAENQGESCVPCHRRYHCLVLLGLSQQQLRQYRRAEATLKKAMQYAKSLLKTKVAKTTDVYTEGMTEIDVKLAMAECHLSLSQANLALSVLESVSPRARTARLNMMLGGLYQQTGMERPAITAYKEVLKECPCAVVAAERLVALGVSGGDVASLMVAGVDGQTGPPDWLVSYVKGVWYRWSRNYSGAVSVFRQLEEGPTLRRSALVLAALGRTHYLAGDSRHALTVLQRAHETDPLSLEGVDLLGTLYYADKRVRDLELLAASAVSVSETEPHPWILLGYYCHLSKRTTKAIYFAHKACSADPHSVEGLLLKGTLLLELKKFQEAVLHFREALQVAPYRFEPYKGLVDCYLSQHRSREALSMASTATKQLGPSTRSVTLYASVLLKDSLHYNKGKNILEKAVKEDPYYLPGVYLLSETYNQERRYDRAIELLNRQVSVQSGCRVHEKLAELHAKQYHNEESAYHHSIAVRYASQGEAVEGVSLGDAGGGGAGLSGAGGGGGGGAGLDADSPASPPDVPHYDMEVEDINDSEGDVELSDLEAGWSDTDFSYTGQ